MTLGVFIECEARGEVGFDVAVEGAEDAGGGVAEMRIRSLPAETLVMSLMSLARTATGWVVGMKAIFRSSGIGGGAALCPRVGWEL